MGLPPATPWAWLTWAPCVIPREAALSSRTTGSRQPSPLPMSWVRRGGREVYLRARSGFVLGALVGEEAFVASSSGDVGILSWDQRVPWYGLSFFSNCCSPVDAWVLRGEYLKDKVTYSRPYLPRSLMEGMGDTRTGSIGHLQSRQC